MSDLNSPEEPDGILGDEPTAGHAADLPASDQAESTDEAGGLGRTPVPPD